MIEFTIEGHTEDENRVRIAYSNGEFSRWFSTLLHTDDDGVLVVPDDIVEQFDLSVDKRKG